MNDHKPDAQHTRACPGCQILNLLTILDEAHAAWARIDRLGNQPEDRQALDAALDPRRWTP